MTYLVLGGVAAVFLILVAGLINMAQGGSSRRTQILMRWRVGLQLVLILALAFVGIFLFRGGS